MKRLSFKRYAANATSPLCAISPVHVVVMHGLMGSWKNWHAVATDLSTPAPPVVTPNAEVATALKQQQSLISYPTVSFDWRNHGESAHSSDHSLDGLAQDLSDFLHDYSTVVRSEAGNKPIDTPSGGAVGGKVPIVLMAHSMGGAGLMNFIWKNHTEFLDTLSAQNEKICLTSTHDHSTPLPEICVNKMFANDSYEIVGAVVVDVGPCPRPESFHRMADAVKYLATIPLDTFHSMADVEKFVIANGPKPTFSQENMWMVKYFLSNLTTEHRDAPSSSSKATPHFRWRCGIHEVSKGMNRLLWPYDNTAEGSGHVYPVMSAFPVHFVFGQLSPYYNATATGSVGNYFGDVSIGVVEGGSHFMFLERKKLFCSEVRSFLHKIHDKA